jgi:WD40 repeat protein
MRFSWYRISLLLCVGIAACLVPYWYWIGGRGIRSYNLRPTSGVFAPSTAISPDGKVVAIMLSATTIEVREVQSDRVIKRFALREVSEDPKKVQLSMTPTLAFCDGGHFVMAMNQPNFVHLIDALNFQIHATIDLRDLYVNVNGSQPGQSFADSNLLSNSGVFACSANSNVAAIAFSGGREGPVKLFNLETGREVADLTRLFGPPDGYYENGGIAVSPDGSRVAIVIGWCECKVDLIDTRSKAILKTLTLAPAWRGNGHRLVYRVAFAGNEALLTGVDNCSSQFCDTEAGPESRSVQVWDLRGKGSVKNLSSPGRETYRFFGGSANGDVIYSFSASEKLCSSCNDGTGGLKVSDARFSVWDRESWKTIAHSPQLLVIHHRCWFSVSCREWDEVPQLQMSANGEAILATWPSGGDNAPFKVFRRR